MSEYEYGVSLRGDLNDPHRAGMSEGQAREWIAECIELGMKPVFGLIRRPVGEWEAIND